MTSFTDVFIRRPVFAMSVSLLLLAIGLAAFFKLTVRQFPKMDASVITVTTSYPGADANLMSNFITTPLENALTGVDGIDYVTSSSTQNTSSITVYFKLNYPIDKALTDVSNAVASKSNVLPKNAFTPVIGKSDPSARAVLYLGFISDTMTPGAVNDYLLRVVQPQIGVLNGVGQVQIYGARTYAMRINIDSDKLTAYNLTASDVYTALAEHNLQSTAGTIYSHYQEFNVSANTDMHFPEQFDDIPLKTVNGTVVRIKDVGYATLGALNYNSSAYFNGKPVTVMGILPTSDANPLAVAKQIKAVLPGLQSKMPAGLKVDIVYDSTIFIQESITEVDKTIVEAVIFVIFVIFLFLGNFRAVLIPIITIPLSLIGVCVIMMALGYSLNTLTLLAWVLAIGLVVDDAIVVLENIHRHMENGMKPIPAAIVGAREIGFAVIAMTITLAAVYAPIGFSGGITGILFSEFAFTLAAAVIVSGFIALTLSPMMCSRLIKIDHDPNHQKIAQKIDAVFSKIMARYRARLQKVLTRKSIVIIFTLLMWLACYFLYTTTREVLAPAEDQGVMFTNFNAPAGSNVKYMEKFSGAINGIYEKQPEVEHVAVINGTTGDNVGVSFAPLVDWNKRDRSQFDIMAAVTPALNTIPGLQVYVIPLPSIPLPGSQATIYFAISSPDGINTLLPAINGLLKAVANNPGFRPGTQIDLKIDQPQINITIDRLKGSDLGISESAIGNTLAAMFASPQNLQFSYNDRSYYVVPEFIKNFNYEASPDDLQNVYVRSDTTQQLIPLSNLASIANTVQPESINHFQQIPSATLQAYLVGSYSTSQAIGFITDYMDKNFPKIAYNYGGQTRYYIQSQGEMTQVMLFALIIIFLVLAAQFESFRDPLIILIVVPITIAAAIAVLRLVGGNMNIYSKIGLTTLIGLIAKHGILIVEFANQLQEKGMSKLDAVVESATLRLRPILMTTGAMVLGALPLAFASGAGAHSRMQIGIIIVAGMTFGTLCSLFVVPAWYLLLANTKEANPEMEREIEEAIEKMERLEDDKK
ncbi:MAG: putative transporter [Gammaproteobacteria bacterium]|jgi:multidrug efflux pump|nr:putative transporter [Gammaproteobacteria bacterium]